MGEPTRQPLDGADVLTKSPQGEDTDRGLVQNHSLLTSIG